jgi:hypothetical protein
LIAIAGIASFRGVEMPEKRAGEYKDEIIAPGIGDAGFVERVTEYVEMISRSVDSIALATRLRCY